MFRLSNMVITVLLWSGVIALGVLIAAAVTSCVLSDPSQWRPEQHMLMSRNCRVVCRPGYVLRYDSMDGSCECQLAPKVKHESH